MKCEAGDYVMIDVLSKRDRVFLVTGRTGETIMLAAVSDLRIHETRVIRNVTTEMREVLHKLKNL